MTWVWIPYMLLSLGEVVAVYALISQACLRSLQMMLFGVAERLWWFMNELAWLLWAYCIYLSQASSLMGAGGGGGGCAGTVTKLRNSHTAARLQLPVSSCILSDLIWSGGRQECVSLMRPPGWNTLMVFSLVCLYSQYLTWVWPGQSSSQSECFCIF